jgi:hypothetical protein
VSRPAAATPPAAATRAAGVSGQGPPIRIERLVVQVPGAAGDGVRIAQRLPSALERALAMSGPLDEQTARRLVEQAVRRTVR